MRRFLIALVLLLGLYVALSRFTEVQQVVNTLRNGNLLWLGLGVLLQMTTLINAALTYRAIYRLMGLKGTLAQLLPLAVASKFIDTVAPSGGVGGMTIFITDARRRGLSTARVTIAGVLYILFEYFAFLCVLAIGMVVLVRRNNLTGVEVGAAGVLLAAALALAGLLVLGASSPPRFERVLKGLARAVNRLLYPIRRRDYLSEERAHLFAVETAEGFAALRTHPAEYVPPALLALLGKVLLILVLLIVFLAFDVPVTIGTLIAGFSMGHLFLIVSPTPAGIGVVEGAMTLTLTTLGVPLGAASVITLAYRGLTFWLPFLYGFAALRILDWQRQKHALEKAAP